MKNIHNWSNPSGSPTICDCKFSMKHILSAHEGKKPFL